MSSARTAQQREPMVRVTLRETCVTSTFRENLFDAANRAGMSTNEFVLFAAAEKLKRSGRMVSGVFHRGDIEQEGMCA